MIHSPFHIVEDFVSPLQCEHLRSGLSLSRPNFDERGTPIKYETFVTGELGHGLIREFQSCAESIEDRFASKIVNTPTMLFQQYWENAKAPAEGLGCENSKFMKKKWVRIKDVDLVGFLWLKSYHDAVPLDPRIECYGGKLEFPAYNFSLTPVAGTLVVFPATPHFITAISHVMLGSLEQIKFGIKLKDWAYQPENFPGSYREWFLE